MRDFIQYAAKKARQSSDGKQRHYCVISDKRGRILSQAANSYTKSSPSMLSSALEVGEGDKVFWHSECRAIHSLPYGAEPYRITVVRVNRQGVLRNSKPCKICMNEIRKHNIPIVEFSTGANRESYDS